MPKYTGLEIAVIGISCRVPGAKDWKEYWDNLLNERESIHHYSEKELLDLGYSKDLIGRKNYVVAEGSIDDKDMFDASFFGYTPTEAEFLNPVHRLFQESAWVAIEDAGLNLNESDLTVGVFASASANLAWPIHSMIRNKEGLIDNFSLTKLISKEFMPTLLSYKLDLKGTSLFIDTGCSSSLVAINNACKLLLLGDIDVALAGGVTVAQKEEVGYIYDTNFILSSDGHCRAFDRDADGTVGSEGAAVVVLKRLKDAIRDKDNIYCVIKGGATNNDGKRKVGYSAPSILGQAECIARALKFSRVEPERVSYIETHGTATKLGDPIEISALKLAYKNLGLNSCAIGSVKTNIGHTWAMSGAAGLIKVALSLKHGIIPASLHYKNPNREINFSETPFYVNVKTQEWKRKDNLPLCAGVSSFGIGGTNAHTILEEFIAEPEELYNNEKELYHVVPLSARSKQSVSRYAGKLHDFVSEDPSIHLPGLAYTMQHGRAGFNYREFLAFKDRGELLDKLKHIRDNMDLIEKAAASFDELVFMFSGSGSQYLNMGAEIYNHVPLFREEMDKGFLLLNELTGLDYKTYLYAPTGNDINEIDKLQVIVFLFDHALARLLLACGIKPAYMIGHSLGEYVCACISGVFSFEDALKIILQRGQLLKMLDKGSMLSAAISPADAGKYLVKNSISLAAVNTRNNVVFSGETDAINALKTTLENACITSSILFVDRAMHSFMIDAITDQFRNFLGTVEMHPPSIPFISNVTGQPITHTEAVSVDYWVKHFRDHVHFADGIACLNNINAEFTYVEIGAGNHLSNFVRQEIFFNRQHKCVNLVRHVKEHRNDLQFLLNAIGNLWKQGVHVDWKTIYNTTPTKVALPTYSFDYTFIPIAVSLSKVLAKSQTTEKAALTTDHTQEEVLPKMKEVAKTNSLKETEEKVIDIFERFFGIQQISLNYTFFELGGDSLKAVNIIRDIERSFNQSLSISLLYNSTNIKDLAAKIHENQLRKHSIAMNPDSNFYTFAEDDKNDTKIFFFPPVVGNPIFFKPLADKLSSVANSYGFYYKGIREVEEMYGSIKEMAQEFAEEIIRRTTDEDIVLFGFSMGAVIAFETAIILESQGRKFSLIVIDKPVNVSEEIPEDINFVDFTPEIDRIYLEILLSDVTITEKRLKKYLLNNHRMVNTNVINTIVSGDIYAFECTEGPIVDMNVWKSQTTGGFSHAYLSGLHWQALNEDKLGIYIDLLENLLMRKNKHFVL